MKGGKCFYCDSTIETNNEECLCNDCLSTVSRPDPVGLAILGAVLLIFGIVFVNMF